MCGIFGMIGENAVKNTLKALKLLEYRGYDSAGIAARRNCSIEVYKTEGRVERLAEIVGDVTSDVAIGHTRWATHGVVCTANAHPFLSEKKQFAIVHNGIIENHLELKRELSGAEFTSQTDSEAVAFLIERNYRGDVLEAVLAAARKLKGSFAIAVTSLFDNKLYAIKNKSPLVVGLSQRGAYLCSDIRCAAHWASKVAVTPDNTAVVLSSSGAKFYDFDGNERTVEFFVPEKAEEAERVDGDFMLKEIFEIPEKLRLAKQNYFDGGGLKLTCRRAQSLSRIYLIGCGTAYHSGLQAATVARRWTDIDIIPVIASEFIYGDYPVGQNTLAFFISQSGETADTVRATERVKSIGGITYAVTNTLNSSLTFACEYTADISAGGEYAVASTKAYNCQLLTLTLLLMDIARLRGTLDMRDYSQTVRGMDKLPEAASAILSDSYLIARLAETVKDCGAVFYIGRKADYPTACEGSLKLKEISYIHSEAYPAGELKHGTLALMDSTVAVVAVSTDETLFCKVDGSVTEVASRGARVLGVSSEVMSGAETLLIPKVHRDLAGIISVIPLQLLAYYTAKRLGRDVDKPRNLAKSVTVE